MTKQANTNKLAPDTAMDQEIFAEEVIEEQIGVTCCASSFGTVGTLGSCVGSIATCASLSPENATQSE